MSVKHTHYPAQNKKRRIPFTCYVATLSLRVFHLFAYKSEKWEQYHLLIKLLWGLKEMKLHEKPFVNYKVLCSS